MERRQFLDRLIKSALILPVLPQTIEGNELIRVPNHDEQVALLNPPTVQRYFKMPLNILAVSGAILETDQGPLLLKRHEFQHQRVFYNQDVTFYWQINFYSSQHQIIVSEKKHEYSTHSIAPTVFSNEKWNEKSI